MPVGAITAQVTTGGSTAAYDDSRLRAQSERQHFEQMQEMRRMAAQQATVVSVVGDADARRYLDRAQRYEQRKSYPRSVTTRITRRS